MCAAHDARAGAQSTGAALGAGGPRCAGRGEDATARFACVSGELVAGHPASPPPNTGAVQRHRGELGHTKQSQNRHIHSKSQPIHTVTEVASSSQRQVWFGLLQLTGSASISFSWLRNSVLASPLSPSVRPDGLPRTRSARLASTVDGWCSCLRPDCQLAAPEASAAAAR